MTAALTASMITLGCKSAGAYRHSADEVASEIITAGQTDALGRTEPFTIETPADTLRRRLIEAQQLPISNPAGLGVDQLLEIKHWPKDDYLKRERPDAPQIADEPLAQPVKLTLLQALQVAAANSRDYQSAKEDVFLTALDLDLERDAFRLTLAGVLDSFFSYDPGDGGETTGITNTADLSATQMFKNGLTVTGGIIIDLVKLLGSGGEESLGLLTDLSISLPLLAGSGEHIVTEPLTQAERDVLYALWDFEEFKREFAVRVASDYLSVLQQLDRVVNAEDNYRRLITSLELAQANAEVGRMSAIQVDQARQDVLRARENWVSAQSFYATQLDNFKVTLGLPTDAVIDLDPEELSRLAATAEDWLRRMSQREQMSAGYSVADDGTITLNQPTQEGAGPLELPEPTVVQLAFGHRLDLRIAQHEVDDALRGVVVAGDALRPGLTLTASGTAGERRTIDSTGDDAELRPEEGEYSVGLSFDLPWEKTAERNAYRGALIDLERQVRDVQQLEDQIKLDMRDGLRNLRQARESFRIQAQAVELAERRVDSAGMFFQYGRVQIRDVLDAQSDLLDAQNALTNALVNYRVTGLELQRDMGVLEVNERGMWNEYVPQQPDEQPN